MFWLIEAEWRICVSELFIIGSDNGLSPGRRQAIIWTNAGILSIGPLGTNFSEIFIECHTFSLKKMHLKISSGKWRPFCIGLNVLRTRRVRTSWEQITVVLSVNQSFNLLEESGSSCWTWRDVVCDIACQRWVFLYFKVTVTHGKVTVTPG